MNGENLGELFAAMALARQEFGVFTKSKTATIKSDKGSYGYAYADLSDIIEATAAALAKHGLVVIQEPEVVSDGGRQLVVIHGCIAHKSGGVYQFRSLPLPVAGNTAQAIGSAISYARRYQLSAALNLAASDDDGKAASDMPAPQPRRVNADTGEITESIEGDVIFAPDSQRVLASQSQRNLMHALGMEYYKTAENWDKKRPQWVRDASGGAVESSNDLSPEQITWVIELLQQRIANRKAQMAAAEAA